MYTNRARQFVLDEFDSIYVTGRDPNINFTGKVVDAIKKKNIATHMWTRKHKHKDRYGTTVVLALFRNFFAQKSNMFRST